MAEKALHDLSPTKGSRKTRKRVGRGESSGQGKTCGKGHKGQKARSGVSIAPGFEGGQMPLYRRIPKLGFTSPGQITGSNQYKTLNVSDLERFEDGATVSIEEFEKLGFVKRTGAGVKILGNGELKKKLTIQAHAASKSAKEKIEAAGGSLEIVAKKAAPEAPQAEAS